ncbi:putative tyrosinase central domain containing protein [Diaporthe ampelina]|uniref:Putative tyrosinase central domain containing protein n=1 Tax=Diaporthe ampelina TaxID=1214573 RepID=A0A0G2FI58_9PEZI|nr:putative tyrosinase central domain containing protein [Diaporthe ampelina]
MKTTAPIPHVSALLTCIAPVLGVPSALSPRAGDRAKEQVTRLISSVTSDFVGKLDACAGEPCSEGGPIAPSCTSDTIVYRREYGSLSEAERLDYVNAVKCLQRLPARTPASVAPGARSRFDDFVAVHINQTLTLHFTGNFMPWHRWFVHVYETALRDECGYSGYQPYWDWPKYQHAPQDSPIFNGDPYSLGGNGQYIPHNGTVITPPDGVSGGDIQLPAGVGGGYVVTGPFANLTINLGPFGGTFDLLEKPTITDYRLLSEGVPYTVEIGPHGGGHYVINGDPGGDLFTSPGDPAFWVHHGQMDRLWTLWQARNPSTAYTQLDNGTYGHITWANDPASRLTELDDIIDMGYAGPSVRIRDVMSTTSGPFCYFYEESP